MRTTAVAVEVGLVTDGKPMSLDVAKLRKSAVSYYNERGAYFDFEHCTRIMVFPPKNVREKTLIAVEFSQATKPLSMLWIWFDSFGNVLPNAEPQIVGETIISGSPDISEFIGPKEVNSKDQP